MLKDYFSMLRFVRPHLKVFIIAVLFMMLTALFDCVSIGMILPLTDKIMAGKEIIFPYKIPIFLSNLISYINKLDRAKFLMIVGYGIVILFFLKGLFTFLHTYFMSKVGQLVVRDIRNTIYAKLHQLSLEYFISKRSGELISRITSDVLLIENAVCYGVTDLFYQSFQVIFFSILIFVINWKLALLVFLLMPFITIPIIKIGRRVRKLSKQTQEKMADINSLLLETITGVRIVRAFCMEQDELERFRKQNGKI